MKENLFKAPFGKRLFLMLTGVIVMGVSVTILNMTNFGVDPCAAFSFGFKDVIGLSFGTTQLALNLVLLIAVLFFDRSKLGFGTIGNMVVVGYTVDFTTFVFNRIGFTEITGFTNRLVIMIVTLAIFIVAVALYVNAGLGAAPYDVIPNIVQESIKARTGKEIPFRYIRMSYDALFTILAFVFHGSYGAITILMVLTLGPIIEWVAKLVNKLLKLDV